MTEQNPNPPLPDETNAKRPNPESANTSGAENAERPNPDNAKRSGAQNAGNSDAENGGKMALSGHLRELRNRLLICLSVFLLVMTIGLYYARELVRFLLALGERYQYDFVYIAPQELLTQYFAVDFVFALCLTLPVLLYELWAFVRPGLRGREKLAFPLSLLFGTLCAALGVLFAYRILLPFTLRFLIAISTDSGVRASVSVQNYISFLLTIFIVFALIFELPVVTLLLTRLNLLKVSWMRKFRRPVIVLIFFVGAVITPPDVVSQILVALPLLGLYELSIVLCALAARLSKRGSSQENP